MSTTKSPPIANRLLAALPKKDYQALHHQLEEVPLVFEEILYRPNVLISDVYFPNSGILSLLAGVNGRATLEVGLVGKEGMLGMSVFMGVNTSQNRVVVQGAGSAMRIKATAFRKHCNDGGVLPRVLRRYSHSLTTQITQPALCNQFHTDDARLARCLLMTHDHKGDGECQLTQDFLSSLFGRRREGVNRAAAY